MAFCSPLPRTPATILDLMRDRRSLIRSTLVPMVVAMTRDHEESFATPVGNVCIPRDHQPLNSGTLERRAAIVPSNQNVAPHIDDRPLMPRVCDHCQHNPQTDIITQ